MSTDHDILKVTQRMVADLGCTMADLAETVGRQQSALIRTLSHNPTVRVLQDVAWAMGLGLHPDAHGQVPDEPPHWYWLCVPYRVYMQAIGVSYRPNRACPMLDLNASKATRKLTRHATWGRGPDYDPTDKTHLATVYPAKAIAGAGPDGAPVDSRFIQDTPPEPLHGKSSQGPGGASRTTSQSMNLSGHRHVEGEGVERVQAPHDTGAVPGESTSQRQTRLAVGAPQGYRMSLKALADAPRSAFELWQKAGWDADRMIDHGYLEVDPSDPPEYLEDKSSWYIKDEPDGIPGQHVGDISSTTDLHEARRLEASSGCPEGWILSDRALEYGETVTFDQLVTKAGLSVDRMKAEKLLVPRAWLGYD